MFGKCYSSANIQVHVGRTLFLPVVFPFHMESLFQSKSDGEFWCWTQLLCCCKKFTVPRSQPL